MRLRIGLVVAISVTLVATGGVSAQSGRTDDGVAAFVRGDYPKAVELLKPSAERWQMPLDGTAAFFMALMYDNGLGVAQDPVRACALMLRTSIHSDSVGQALTFAAQTLADDFNSRLAPEQMHRCLFLANQGFDSGFAPQTLTLAPGHWIRLEESSPNRNQVTAQIEYAGKQREVELRVPAMPGVRFLPFVVTEVTSLRPRPERRHFLEAFTALPLRTNQWTLMWFVFEVVRDTLVEVTFEELQVVEGDQPPAYETADLRRLAAVRVNAEGDAEWVVGNGAGRRGDVIETDAERQELAADKRAREAAEKAVDWTVRRAIDRVPSLSYSAPSNEGCMGPVAYSWSTDRTEAIVLSLDRDAFSALNPASTFVVGVAAGVEIAAHVYDAPQRRSPFCSDLRITGDDGERWRGVAGTLTIELTSVFRVREPETYRATIRLTGAEFVSATGARVRPSQPITFSTTLRAPQY
jgi:hypothetical protein